MKSDKLSTRTIIFDYIQNSAVYITARSVHLRLWSSYYLSYSIAWIVAKLYYISGQSWTSIKAREFESRPFSVKISISKFQTQTFNLQNWYRQFIGIRNQVIIWSSSPDNRTHWHIDTLTHWHIHITAS